MKIDDKPNASDMASDPGGSTKELALFATMVGFVFAAGSAGVQFIGRPAVSAMGSAVNGVTNAVDEANTESVIDSDDIY